MWSTSQCVGPGDQTKVIKLGDKGFYLLSRLAGALAGYECQGILTGSRGEGHDGTLGFSSFPLGLRVILEDLQPQCVVAWEPNH